MTVGIYALIFTDTDNTYIGQSSNIEDRYNGHLSCMKRGTSAKKLQNAYDTFGAPSLEILQVCSPEELYRLEKVYICEFDSVNNGFNSSIGGEAGNSAPGELNIKAIGSNCQYLKALELLVITAYSCDVIAEKTGLTTSIVSKISSGEGHRWLATKSPELYSKLKTQRTLHKNVKLSASRRVFNQIVSPEGVIYSLEGVKLSDFYKLHNLTASKVSELLNGHRIVYKGWHTGKYTIKSNRSPSTVESPEGVLFTVTYGEYTKFAKSHGLDPGAFRRVIAGTASHHHGWKLAAINST